MENRCIVSLLGELGRLHISPCVSAQQGSIQGDGPGLSPNVPDSIKLA